VKAIDITNAEIGTVSSRQDGSVAFRVITPELRPSEAGAVMGFHGKACRVLIAPHEGVPEETVAVDTEREQKTPSQRLRGVLFLVWKKGHSQAGSFEDFYARKMEAMIESWKDALNP
jgi:hypothetical protein